MSVEGAASNVGGPAPQAGAVFLSYANQDGDAARRIADALRASGVEVWFDQSELRGGEAWDASIRQQIRSCALFMPIVSAQTQARAEGYFRREWKLAAERTQDIAAGVAFLMPVVIDDTLGPEALAPEEFMRVQWTRLPGGGPTPEFVARVKSLLTGGVGGMTATPFGARRRPTLAPMAQNVTNTPMRSRPPMTPLPPLAPKPPPPVAAPEPEAAAAVKKRRRTTFTLTLVLLLVLTGGLVGYHHLHEMEDEDLPWKPSKKRKPAAAKVEVFAKDKSIAVLPFANMSEDKENGFFADGVHEDVLTNLALIREFRVVSRTTVQAYRDTKKSVKEIAQDLGVAYILEGSVRRSGNKLRVTGQLIHAATDEHVWAQTYDRELTDVFAIQAELSQQIAGALKTALSPEEKVMIARRPTENPVAYDLFLRARDIRNRENVTVDAFRRRVELLQKSAEADPAFAEAWGELAETYAFGAFSEYRGKDEFLAKAKVAIERAMSLRPDDPDVIASLGTYHYYGFRNYAKATEQFEKLAHLQPNSAAVLNSLALIKRRQGRWAQSLADSKRAVELDPANIRYLRNLLSTLTAGRRFKEAYEVQQRIAALLPDRMVEGYELALIPYWAKGDASEAVKFFAALTPEQRDSSEGTELQKRWALAWGDFGEAIRLDRIQPFHDAEGTPHWQQSSNAAWILFITGDKAAAVARLGDASEELRKQVEAEPTNAECWAYLAGVEVMLGNNAEAVRCVERSAQLLPESVDALDGVRYARFRVFILGWLRDDARVLAEAKRLLTTPYGFWPQALRNAKFPVASDKKFKALLDDPKNNRPLF